MIFKLYSVWFFCGLDREFQIFNKTFNREEDSDENKNNVNYRPGFFGLHFSACSFSTANVSELKFGKNDTAKPSATSFNTGEKIFAVATVSNAMGKHKLAFNVKYDNVAGKGERAAKSDMIVDGDSEAFFNFTTDLPGTYSVEAVLSDEMGKEFNKKSGTITVTGSAPTAPAAPRTDDDADADHK